MPTDPDALLQIGRELIVALGDDPDREGLRATPWRFARAWQEFMDYDEGETTHAFEAVTTDQMVVVTGMKVWSICEHHLLPFWCDLNIGYIAEDRVLGLSKFARIAHKHAHKLQLQERLCDNIASEIAAITGSFSVAVMARGQHFCTVMRGVKTPATLVTSVMLGDFRTCESTRAEFLEIVR